LALFKAFASVVNASLTSFLEEAFDNNPNALAIVAKFFWNFLFFIDFFQGCFNFPSIFSKVDFFIFHDFFSSFS